MLFINCRLPENSTDIKFANSHDRLVVEATKKMSNMKTYRDCRIIANQSIVLTRFIIIDGPKRFRIQRNNIFHHSQRGNEREKKYTLLS
jgi:hypothetical protein